MYGGVMRGFTRLEFPVEEVPEEEGAIAEVDEVYWTVDRPSTLAGLSNRWGISTSTLVKLNPGLSSLDALDPGTMLKVYEDDPSAPSKSYGAPNAGRLKRGVPLPEGPHVRMREYRTRSFGSKYMVEALTTAFDAYSDAFPDGPEIRLGDLSMRGGGRLSPHVSHRTGRDVDIGFVLREDKRKDRYWERARPSTFDAEKNWFLIRELIETGRVQTIFMGARLQRELLPYARRDLTPDQLAQYFAMADKGHRYVSIIRHWRGHMDHMHVRFHCEPDNRQCRSNSIER